MIRAQRRFYESYGLPEFANPISKKAATDFLRAGKADRLPEWVVALADISDIRHAARQKSGIEEK